MFAWSTAKHPTQMLLARGNGYLSVRVIGQGGSYRPQLQRDSRSRRALFCSKPSDPPKKGQTGHVDERTVLPIGISRPFGIISGAMFFSNLGFGCVVPVLLLFATSMGLGASGVGTILSTSALARLVMNIPMGRAADKFGRRPLMVAGGGTVAAASILTGFATDLLTTLLGAWMLVGCGGSAAGAGTGAYMADIASKVPGQRAKIMGMQSTIINGAYAVGPAVGGYLCDRTAPGTCSLSSVRQTPCAPRDIQCCPSRCTSDLLLRLGVPMRNNPMIR